MKSGLLPLWVLLTGLLAFVLVIAGADTTRAGTFNPTLEVTVANPEPETSSDFTTEFGVPAGDVNFAAVVGFIPKDWGIVPGDEVEIGTQVGTLGSTATLGLVNGACNTPLPVSFNMLNGSLDPADTVSFLDDEADEDTTGEAFEDADANSIPDAVDKFPDFIQRIVPDLVPMRRAAGVTSVAGVNVLLQFLVYEPGSIINEALPSDAELGYPSVTFLQNIGDPDAEPAPNPITDFCSPLESTNVSLGTAEDGTTLFVNPQDGTYTFTTVSFGQRDADNDGHMNSLDTCPFAANTGDPTVAGDGDEDLDGLDTACDPDGSALTGTKSDEDDDGYPNRGDNCPLVANGEDTTNQEDADSDSIGDECDTEGNGPNEADGELSEATLEAQVVIGEGTGPGGPPEGFPRDGGGGGDDDGGSTLLIIIIVAVVAGVIVIGGGAAYAMRRRG